MKLFTVIAFIITLTSCATQAKYSDEVMYDMASILKDVTQAIDGELKFGDTSGLTNEKIIENAMSTNPNLLTRLSDLAIKGKISDYRIVYEYQGDNAVLLICDGDIALMEDVGCNAAFDKVYWNDPQPNTCKITLNASAICVK